ncbi:MAG TPA: tetratricopeptide repeat protein [Thermoanaerobaculia bacterium]|nr:tetratricopeptide repeat protein [Thermoanaerobaculia bacterium]
MRRALVLTVLLALALAGRAPAGTEARLTGKVIDAATKKPIENAVITVVSTEKRNFKQDFRTKKDGTYAIFLLDGTIRYKFTWSAPGYAAFEDTIKLDIGIPNTRDIALVPANAVAAPAAGAKAPPASDPAVEAFNEGATLANEGKIVEAIAKFEEAIAKKPDLTAGYRALAKLHLRTKDYAKAIERANRALAVDDEDSEMYAVLFEAYTATGDKAKAAEAKAKMPANPGMLFNDAAKLINAGKDAEAEQLLKQAIAADENFALAYYELGMIYVRAGKSGEARTNLEKYIALDPNGKEAATAREMLKYIQ